jgi:hypothetical protein
MRITILPWALLFAVLVVFQTGGHAQTAAGDAQAQSAQTKATAIKTVSTVPPVQSGIYGFSGARPPDPTAAPSGVVGECIWIFDAGNKNQVAKGDCTKKNPGDFRVALRPGHYVVRGPGGDQTVLIKLGGWVKVTSIALIPVSF